MAVGWMVMKVLTPGLMPTTDMDINHYHRTTANTHPRLLGRSAEQQGIKLKPGLKLLPCVGCSASKGYSTPGAQGHLYPINTSRAR